MKHWGINLEDLFVRRLGAGNGTYFWKDKWCDSVVLKDVFPELYRIEVQKNYMVNNRIQNRGLDGIHGQWSRNLRRGREATSLSDLNKKVVGVVLTSIDDSWVWKGNEIGGFTVQNLHNLMASAEEVSNTLPFHWEGWAPLKVNCFVWRLCLNRIPVADNLLVRGVTLPSYLCPLSGIEQEDVEHFVVLQKKVWSWFCDWSMLLKYAPMNVSDMLGVVKTLVLNKKRKRLLWALIYSVLWSIWKTRNALIFKSFWSSSMKTTDDI
uniref:Reverse transcriptase zinc-binding domain-containing protein n=1 Tax=Lactuca sativa TaxID=4236 RepID=A0A9R1X397_LACSA|nr:hypothetical protein LSAT_V11C800413410 [Lactuca sativa]